jgi:hypothetical protein
MRLSPQLEDSQAKHATKTKGSPRHRGTYLPTQAHAVTPSRPSYCGLHHCRAELVSAIRTGFTPRLRIRPRTSSDRMGGARRAARTGRAAATSRWRRSCTDIDLPWAHPCSVAPACSGGKRPPRCAHVTFGPAAAFARRFVGFACAHAKLRAPCAAHARCTPPAGSSRRALGNASRRVARACGTGVLARF